MPAVFLKQFSDGVALTGIRAETVMPAVFLKQFSEGVALTRIMG